MKPSFLFLKHEIDINRYNLTVYCRKNSESKEKSAAFEKKMSVDTNLKSDDANHTP